MWLCEVCQRVEDMHNVAKPIFSNWLSPDITQFCMDEGADKMQLNER